MISQKLYCKSLTSLKDIAICSMIDLVMIMARGNNDRLFIDKFDNFIFTVRKMIYFGDTDKDIQPKDPKHDRLRFINYFGNDNEYYDASVDIFDFANDDRLKDEFANIYTYKAMSITEMGDSLQLFSALSKTHKHTGENLTFGSARSSKNLKRRIENGSELLNSGSILASGGSPKYYKRNVDLTEDFDINEEKAFIDALDFAIKKNNFTSFASTYKKLLTCRDNIAENDGKIKIDHQLFHPILDEIHIWTAVSALNEERYINIDYCLPYPDDKELFSYKNLVPIKIIYDNLYGRTYLFVYDKNSDSTFPLRFDRIFHIEIDKEYENKQLINTKILNIEEKLKTAWLVSTNDKSEHVVLKFKNTPAIMARVQNEGRHGKITKVTDDFFIYEIDVNDSVEMTNWVLNFGSNCKVEAPNNFVERIVNYLKGMVK